MYYNGHVCVLGRFVHIYAISFHLHLCLCLSLICLSLYCLFVILVIIWATIETVLQTTTED